MPLILNGAPQTSLSCVYEATLHSPAGVIAFLLRTGKCLSDVSYKGEQKRLTCKGSQSSKPDTTTAGTVKHGQTNCRELPDLL